MFGEKKNYACVCGVCGETFLHASEFMSCIGDAHGCAIVSGYCPKGHDREEVRAAYDANFPVLREVRHTRPVTRQAWDGVKVDAPGAVLHIIEETV